jgi:hypothetical protein
MKGSDHIVQTTGIPVWVAVVVPLVTALLGLLGGGVVRYLLDRRADMARAIGFARVVREELQINQRRLEADERYLLSTGAWEQYGSELAGALLEVEFKALNVVYRVIASVNAQTRALVEPTTRWRRRPGIPDAAARVEKEGAAAAIAEGLLATEWLARGDVPLWKRRRPLMVLTPHPLSRCRCGHRWDHHRWQWRSRPLRLGFRKYPVRVVAHECNVESCECRWWQEAGAITHVPRWMQQRLGVGTQAPPLPEEEPKPTVDTRIPPTAQPGASVSLEDA